MSLIYTSYFTYYVRMQVSKPVASRIRTEIRVTLRVIESLTFSTNDVKILEDLLQELTKTTKKVKESLPKEDGLVIHPTVLKDKAISKQIKLKYLKMHEKAKTYGRLVEGSRVGRKKLDSRYRHRVGKKPNTLRKVLMTKLYILVCTFPLPKLTALILTRVHGFNRRAHSFQRRVHKFYRRAVLPSYEALAKTLIICILPVSLAYAYTCSYVCTFMKTTYICHHVCIIRTQANQDTKSSSIPGTVTMPHSGTLQRR